MKKRILLLFSVFLFAVSTFALPVKGHHSSGRPKTVHVRSYTKKNGTHVNSYYRSRPTHHR